ncbi:MAG: 4Fe-4S binding protein [Rickettsiales bacterium]|jgi:Fe-S-cluster-containing hydrogenase component 2|nr:4Fe-4S binding protein [Rickettsiales bacterium]
MAYKVNEALCVGCGMCASGVCPVGAVALNENHKSHIDPAKCVSCGSCAGVCPVCAIAKDE